MNALTLSLFTLSLSALLLIIGLSIAAKLKPGEQFWPPPNTTGWQHRTFRWLFRGFFLGLVGLSYLEFAPVTFPSWRLLVGIPLWLIGFGLALKWTGFLGWRNAFGDTEGLTTDGIFKWSRNPIYVVSMIGMVGWAMTVNAWPVTALVLIWALLYLTAPLLEEPWLEEQYGDAFITYRQSTPRFIGVSALSHAALTRLELKVPPIIIVFVSMAVMYLLSQSLAYTDIGYDTARWVLVALAILASLSLLTLALWYFRKHHTTMNPLNPSEASNIVNSGPYRFTRNPMYVSMLIILLAWAVYLGQLSTLLGLPFYMYFITRLQIVPEEKLLTDKFGEAFTVYMSEVRRWI